MNLKQTLDKRENGREMTEATINVHQHFNYYPNFSHLRFICYKVEVLRHFHTSTVFADPPPSPPLMTLITPLPPSHHMCSITLPTPLL